MEGDVYDDKLFLDKERETEYYIVRVVKCTAQQECEWEEYFDEYPVAVEGIIYQRGAWRDPVVRTQKERLPPWIPHDVAGTGWGRARGATQSPAWRVVIDLERIHLEEHRRLERNEDTVRYTV